MALPEDVSELGVRADFSSVRKVEKANLEVLESFLTSLTHYSIGVTSVGLVVQFFEAVGQVLDHLVGRLKGHWIARLVQRIKVSHSRSFGTPKDEGYFVFLCRKLVLVTSELTEEELLL